MKYENTREPYQVVAFCVRDQPVFGDPHDRGKTGIQIATELFNFAPADFHATKGGRYNGPGKYGWHFEVYVKSSAADNLAGRNHPDVLGIFE